MHDHAAIVTGAMALLGVIGWLLWQAPRTLSDYEEERLLREYFRRRDAAERRGALWPPRE